MKKLILLVLVPLLFSCKEESLGSVKEFHALTNYKVQGDTLVAEMDLSNAVTDGVVIPAISSENPSGYIHFTFRVKNPSSNPQRLVYKIFYQNESYKLPEAGKGLTGKGYDPASANNFYGSWEDPSDEFHQTAELEPGANYVQIADSIRIIGNPRNEQLYYGAEMVNTIPSEQKVSSQMNDIRSTPEWYAEIKRKAKLNNVSDEEQLRLDATWLLNQKRKQGKVNNRWKRNPRAGSYNFMLVVGTEEQMRSLPYYIRNIGMQDTAEHHFVNPFWYFNYDRPDSIQVFTAKEVLKAKAVLTPSKGLYVDLFDLNESKIDTSFMDQKNTGNTDELYKHAHFQQFFHSINKNYTLKNVPVVYDVVGGNYSAADYYSKAKELDGKRKVQYVSVTTQPGRTAGYDPVVNAIFMKNPGNADPSNAVKENTGVRSRIGFTYGKFRGKIRFPALINKDNVWNGITCAFWLLYQDEDPWNRRNACENTGYIPKHEVGRSQHRERFDNYSEIDIEILKASKYWTRESYRDPGEYKSEDATKNHDIIVACTNWDLACRDPKEFSVGVKNITYADQNFVLNRWDDWYKALTSKFAADADDVVGSDMYFEIDWRPEEIIWRMGKSKDQMKTVGYMSKDNTKIPDNQMITVITQEFHDASWWPPSVWSQDDIPFPAKDITGYVYELEVE